jgi:hypothetical protein
LAIRTAGYSPVMPALSTNVPAILYFDNFPKKNVFVFRPYRLADVNNKSQKIPIVAAKIDFFLFASRAQGSSP